MKSPCRTDIHKLPKVEIFYMSGGADARLLSAMADLGASGVVLAGFGNGTFSDEVGEQLKRMCSSSMTLIPQWQWQS